MMWFGSSLTVRWEHRNSGYMPDETFEWLPKCYGDVWEMERKDGTQQRVGKMCWCVCVWWGWGGGAWVATLNNTDYSAISHSNLSFENEPYRK